MNLIAYVLQNKRIELVERTIKEDMAIEVYSIEDIEDLINLLNNLYENHDVEKFSDRSISAIGRTMSHGRTVCLSIQKREVLRNYFKINLFWGEKDQYEFDECEIIKVDEILWT